jgi:membrane associated rhomboid family serine protease
VLEALGIPNGNATAQGEYVVLVPAEDAARARAELDRYVRENRDRPLRDDAPSTMGWSIGASLVYAFALVAFDVARRQESLGVDWRSAGLASAGMIRDGAWWRAVTALTVHADLLHLASNLAFGAVFGVMLAAGSATG